MSATHLTRWETPTRSEEHTSELQSHSDLVCRLLLELHLYHRDLHSFPTRRSSDLILVPNADVIVRLRPDVRSAERQVSAGEAFVGAAKAAYLPQISIGGAAGNVGNSFDAMGNSNKIGRAHV